MRAFGPYLVLAFLIAAVFANSLPNSFVWDDHEFLDRGNEVDLSLRDVPRVFTSPLWELAGVRDAVQVYYRPAAYLYSVINYKLWGFDPRGFHLTALLLHFLNASVLYRLGLLLFGGVMPSLMAASLFAVHPVHNESLGRAVSGEAFLGFFLILSFYFFLRKRRYASWAMFLLAVLTKETAVMLPFFIGGLAVRGEGLKKGLYRTLPYLVITGFYLAARAMILDSAFGYSSDRPFHMQAMAMITAVADYARLFVFPYPLSPFYPAEWHSSVLEPKVLAAMAGIALLISIGYRSRKDGILLGSFLCGFILLVPAVLMVNTFPVLFEKLYLSERYLYVSVAAFSVFAIRSAFKHLGGKRMIVGLCVLVISVFSFLTAQANKIWRDDVTLSLSAVGGAPDAAGPHYMLAHAYARKGLAAEAEKEYRAVLSINPNSWETHNTLGTLYYGMGRAEDALAEYKAALRIKPDCSIYHNIGSLYADKGMLGEAVWAYRLALDLDPSSEKTHNMLGLTYYRQGRLREATDEFMAALEIDPYYAKALANRGMVHISEGRYDDAISVIGAALRLDPNHAGAHNNLGYAYEAKGLKEEALKEFRAALAISPGMVEAKEGVARLLRNPSRR